MPLLACTALSTQHYTSLLQTFPTNSEAGYPKDFKKTVTTIFKRLFRVFAIIYCSHFETIEQLGAAKHLNTSFKVRTSTVVLHCLRYNACLALSLQALKLVSQPGSATLQLLLSAEQRNSTHTGAAAGSVYILTIIDSSRQFTHAAAAAAAAAVVLAVVLRRVTASSVADSVQ
jgi:Mob1/phocein family